MTVNRSKLGEPNKVYIETLVYDEDNWAKVEADLNLAIKSGFLPNTRQVFAYAKQKFREKEAA